MVFRRLNSKPDLSVKVKRGPWRNERRRSRVLPFDPINGRARRKAFGTGTQFNGERPSHARERPHSLGGSCYSRRHGGRARHRQPNFISILTNKLPQDQRARARRIGIGLALILRLGLLGTIAFIVHLTNPIFTLFGHGFSWRDLILIGGGLFLVWKSTKEIHHNVDPDHGDDHFEGRGAQLTFASAIVQILLLDLVFSLDSIITAVGMTDHVPIMMVAVTVMLVAADPSPASSITTRPSSCLRSDSC